MTGFNLPPGCKVSDLPGNRPEDEAFEKALQEAEEELCVNCDELKEECNLDCKYLEDKANEIMENGGERII